MVEALLTVFIALFVGERLYFYRRFTPERRAPHPRPEPTSSPAPKPRREPENTSTEDPLEDMERYPSVQRTKP